MNVVGVMDRGWRMRALSAGWRRQTGVLRAHLMASPLFAFVDPRDVRELVALAALIDYVGGSVRVRVGRPGHYTPVEITASRWRGDECTLEVHNINGELPRSTWWVVDEATLPPEPALFRAS